MLCALALVSSTAFAPAGMHRSIVSPRAAVDMSAEPMSRRQAMGFAAAAALGVAPAFADDEVAVAPPPRRRPRRSRFRCCFRSPNTSSRRTIPPMRARC